MKIGVLKETAHGETRVALTPASSAVLVRDKHEVFLERGAGIASACTDEQYTATGVKVVDDAAVYKQADVIIKVQPPSIAEVERMKQGISYIGYLAPYSHTAIIKALAQKNITAFSIEYIPRISRAQSMDALSSMATIGGYKAVVLAAETIGKMFPLMMTAAGTIPPATVLILGAGVAGLQAIATSKRLGAKVEAFDPRPAVKEQVKSLGAMFIDMELPPDAETEGGYAKELSPDFIKKEMEVIGARLPKVEVVICTAQVFGRRAPVLITGSMVGMLRYGSVIVDLAAENGGNCELTEPGKTVVKHGVTIIGAMNLPATLPVDASQMYSRNLLNFCRHLYPKPGSSPDFNEEIIKAACITRNGEVVSDVVRTLLMKGGART